MYDVFVSYARDDRERVARLVERLVAARGWSVWWDTALRPGEEFPREIQQAVASARAVVVVWSPHSIDSDWVIAEASEGWEREVLVPVLIDDCVPPVPFRQTQAADLRGWRGDADAPPLLALIDSIDRVLASQPPPAPDEIAARATRVGAARARRRRRMLAIAAAVLAAIAVVAIGGWQMSVRRAADALAGRAEEIRDAVLATDDEEAQKVWWYVLVQDPERLDRLDVGTLLAVEAWRTAKTARTEEALHALLAISPWSDEHVSVEYVVGAIGFTSDARYVVASGGIDGTLVWDRRAGEITVRIAHGGTGAADEWKDRRGSMLHRGPFVLAVSDAGPIFATAGPDETAAVWDAPTGAEVARLAHEDVVTAVAFAPGGDALATVTESGIVRLWDVAERRELWRAEHDAAAYWVGVSPRGTYVASVAGDGVARVWNREDGALVASIATGGVAEAGAFGADDGLFAVHGAELPAIVLWDMRAAARVRELPVASNDAAGVVFGRDGTLVSGDTDGRLAWWDDAADAPFRTVTVDDYVVAMDASSDGARVATAASDDIARVFETASGRELRQMPYSNWLTAVALSADGRWLASAGQEIDTGFVIEVTEVRPEDPVAAACARVQRNLTRAEWSEYVGGSRPYRETCALPTDE
jgi:WD40 repeat protein